MDKKKKYNIKKIILRVIFIILILAHCLLIFVYSSQNAVESTEVSNGVVSRILYFILGRKEASYEQIKMYDPLIRKLAHFCIYMSMGISCGCLLCTFFSEENDSKKDRKRIVLAILIGFLYSCSDEIHQMFSDGRAGRIIDVIIDTIGVANGVLIVILFLKIVKRLKTKKYNG